MHCRDLQALAREAHFYRLPALLDIIQETCIMPSPESDTAYDTLFFETGFRGTEGMQGKVSSHSLSLLGGGHLRDDKESIQA